MSDITDGIVVTLVNVHFKDRYVDLHNGDSTGIIQGYKGNGSVAQKWSFQSQGGDKYKAKSSVQNTFAYVPGGVQPGEGLSGDVQATIVGIKKVSDHTVQITVGDALAWTLPSRDEGTQIILGENKSTDTQFWTWAPAD